MSLPKSVKLENAQTAVPCTECKEETTGQYYCMECKDTLCPQCEKYHRRSASSRGHNIVLRTQIGDVDTTTLICTDHGDQGSFQYEKCNIPVGSKCVTRKQQSHKMVKLTDKLGKGNINKMQTESCTNPKKRRRVILIAKEKNEEKTQQITPDLESENRTLNRDLDKRHRQRRKNLDSIPDSQFATSDDHSKEIKTKIEYQSFIEKNTLPALMNITKGKQSMPEIGSESLLSEPAAFVRGNIHTTEENRRKLLASSPSSVVTPLKLTTPTTISKFKCPFKVFPSLCISKRDDVWLCGYESRELVMVDIKGQVLRRRRLQNRGVAMAVMDCGDVIISPRPEDSRSVSRLLNNDTENIVFDTSPSYSNGVSVTADQKILICTLGGRVVRTNVDGTDVKQIYNGSGEFSAVHAVENADGNIYISAFKKPAVVIVSKDGKVLSTITHTTGGQRLGRPCGLVVDKMGNILCADAANDCVYIIDQKQQIRELIGRSYGLHDPRWLSVDSDNNLWITQDYGPVVVVKYYSL